MKLVVGLGNPGRKYENTRHNAGFLLLDELVERSGSQWRSDSRFESEVSKAIIAGEECLALKPQTFMNLSGRAVQKAAAYFKIPLDDIVVVYDDIDVPPGKVKVRVAGGHGGHNGVRSIIECLGSAEFPRVKLGVGKPDGSRVQIDVADWVLSPMGPAEIENLKTVMADEALLRLKNMFQGSRSRGL